MSSPVLQLASDVELLTRFRKLGDELAFRVIVQRHTPQVLATCRRLVSDPGHADDAVQETFFRLVKRPGAVRSNLGGWLHRTATRVCHDRYRSAVRRQRREADYARQTKSRHVDAASATPTTWAEIEPHIDLALAQLSDQDADVLIGHFLNGQSLTEMAHDRGVSVSAMSQRLKRALKRLRVQLSTSGVRVGVAALAGLLTQAPTVSASAGLMTGLGSMAMASGSLSAAGAPGVLGAASGLGSTLTASVSGLMTPAIKTGLVIGVSVGAVTIATTMRPASESSAGPETPSVQPLQTPKASSPSPSPVPKTTAPAQPVAPPMSPPLAEPSYLVVLPSAEAMLEAASNQLSLVQHPNSVPDGELLTVVYGDGRVDRLTPQETDAHLRRTLNLTLNDLVRDSPTVAEP